MDIPVGTPWPWTVVLPVKGGPFAKTRLSPLGSRRLAIAAAVATDTVAAVAGSSRVAGILVVSADAAVRSLAATFGAESVADPALGLDAAVRAGLDVAPRHRPCAILLADLPAVRPRDVTRALDACMMALAAGAATVVVPDTESEGTVLLAAAHPAALHPQFGPGSAVRHARGGVSLDLALPRLRRDVDTSADLEAAIGLGVGRATTAVLSRST